MRSPRILRTTGILLGLVGALPAVAFAQQLDETWQVKIGNQAVQVDPDGGFRIPNVFSPDLLPQATPGGPPCCDFLGDNFVRVVGVSEAQGLFLFSEPFQITSGQTFLIGDLTITPEPPPFPEFITIGVSPQTLTTPGEIGQATVTGTLLDGVSTVDVTSRAAFTVYQSSNPDVASVGVDGAITAQGDGTVFITATNEGSTSVAQVNVSFGDALTTVVGVVTLEDGTLVQGADVTVSGLGLSTTTDAAGTFSIASVPTLLGDLDVFVSAPVLAETFIGSSTDLSPEAGLATDSGVIVIRSPCDPKPPGGPSPAHGGLDVALDAQLSWSETQELGTGKTWLVVGSVSSNMSQAATALGATIQTTVDFDNVLLDDIDVVAFTLGSSGSFTAGPTTLTKLTNFVSAGGGLYVELAGGTGDNWSWVPTPGLTSFNSNYDDISIVDPLSPIVTAISDPQLDGWGQSAHSEFLEVGLTNVVLTRTSSGNEVLLTTSLGSGPICYSNLHMADHSQGAPVLQNTMGFLEIPACDPRVYDVYLDVVNPPTTLVCADVTETSCDPGGLLPGVTYFWQVVAKSGLDTTPSAVWTFSTVDS